VLGALATTGGAGALVGTGTGALFTDEETFTDNGIRASTSVAGTVDLEIDATVPDDGDEVIYDVELPDGSNNNPAYIWLATTCPTPEDLGLATVIEVTVECNGKETTFGPGLASHVLNELRFGVPLCRDEDGNQPCLQVGKDLTVTIEVIDTTSYSGSSDDDTLTFDIELSGTQCRYNADNDNPFNESDDDNCVQEISYVAFCAEEPDALDPTYEVNTRLTDDPNSAPTSIDWSTDVDVDYVIVKTGQGGDNEEYIVYDYSGVTKTHGTAAVGDRRADFRGDENDVSGYDNNGDVNNEPCQFAKDALGPSGDFSGGFVKLEEDGGELKEEGS
jgi:predicted ribosomally synthesized peptide with SipW-like signal peptide